MNEKKKKFLFFTTFLVAGFSLLAGLGFSSPNKAVQRVSADDTNNYYLTGTMNEWDTANTDYPLEKIRANEFKFEGLINDGAAYVKFKITKNNAWADAYGYNHLEDESKPLFYTDNDGNIEIGARNNGILIILDTSKEEKQVSATYELYTLNNIVQSTKEGINPSRMRVWLDRGMYEGDGALNALQYGPKGTVTDESTIYEASGYRQLFEVGDHWLAYFDIPTTDLTAGMDIRVVRVSSARDQIWNRTEFYTWQTGDNNKVLYIGDNWDRTTLTPGIIGDDKEIPVAFLKDVLEGYLTCLPSAINGYGAFPEMSRTFFKKDDGEWKIVGLLDEIEINDYVSMDTGYASGRTATVDAYTKYATMEALHLAAANGAGAPVKSSQASSMGIVLIIGLLGITSIGAFYFLQKKKYS